MSKLDLGALTRREFLAATAAAALGSRRAFAQRIVPQIPYEILDETGRFAASDLHRFRERTQPAISRYVARNASEHGFPDRIVQVITGYEFGDGFITDPSQAEKYSQFARASIEDALEFWDSPLLDRPEIVIKVPTKKEEVIEEPQLHLLEDPVIYVNILRNNGTQVPSNVSLHYPDKTHSFTADLSDIRGKTKYGSASRVYSYSIEDDGVSLRALRQPIKWYLQQGESFSVHETPAHEVLHNQLGIWTDDYLLHNEGLQELLGKPAELQARLDHLGPVYIEYEEILVDSLATAWLIGYAQRTGLELDDPFYSTPQTEAMLPKVEVITPRRLISEYRYRGPRRFVEEIVEPSLDEVKDTLNITD
tara:strand:+ start:3626 stop:4717 length:1092 start_codon:yes stop_codon:yes gene_type:complete